MSAPPPGARWKTLGGIVALVCAIAGLVAVCFVVVVFVSLAQFGSNK